MKIKKNFALNMLSALLPTVVSIVGIGVLARNLNSAEFGYFITLLAIVNYFLIIDFGLSGALIQYFGKTQYIAEKSAVARYVFKKTSVLSILTAFGLIIGSEFLAGIMSKSAGEVKQLTECITILSLGLPALIVTNVLNSIMEALGRLELLVLNKVWQSMCVIFIPALVAIFEPNLYIVCISSTVGRYSGLVFALMNHMNRFLFASVPKQEISYSTLNKFGGWVAVSNVVSPLMVSLDKLIVANVLGPVSAGTYSLGTELMNKLMIVPQAACRVIVQIGERNINEETDLEYLKKYVNAFAILCIVLVYIFSENIVEIWIGKNQELVMLIKILLVGFLLNSSSQFYYNKLMAFGRSREVAIIHIIELPIFIGLLLVASKELGVIGAGYVWVGRMALDYMLMRVKASLCLL